MNKFEQASSLGHQMSAAGCIIKVSDAAVREANGSKSFSRRVQCIMFSDHMGATRPVKRRTGLKTLPSPNFVGMR